MLAWAVPGSGPMGAWLLYLRSDFRVDLFEEIQLFNDLESQNRWERIEKQKKREILLRNMAYSGHLPVLRFILDFASCLQ